MILQNKNIIRLVIGTALILTIPILGMMFGEGWNWTLFDFVIAGVILFGAGFAFEIISSLSSDFVYKAGVGISVMTGLLLVWINGAVGIIGDEGTPANLLYFIVFFVGFLFVWFGGFEPKGMKQALIATAISQALIPIVAFFIWRPSFDLPPGLLGVFALNAFFVLLWMFSALLFKRAEQKGVILTK